MINKNRLLRDTVDEMKFLVIADKEGQQLTHLSIIYVIMNESKCKLMAYKGDTAYLINISDILRFMREIKSVC